MSTLTIIIMLKWATFRVNNCYPKSTWIINNQTKRLDYSHIRTTAVVTLVPLRLSHLFHLLLSHLFQWVLSHLYHWVLSHLCHSHGITVTSPSLPFIHVQKLFRINGFHAGFVHSRSSSFKGSMDVRPSTLRTYVLTPSGRTSIDPLNVRPQHPWSYDHKKQIKRPQ